MSDENSKYGVLDWRGRLLTADQMLKLAESPDGRRELSDYILKARVAFGLVRVLERLNVVPPADVQQDCCLVLWESIFAVPIEAVLEWAKQVADALNRTDEAAGNC